MNDYCLYVHTNKKNGKIYIGITNNTERRWRNNGIEYKPKEKILVHFGTQLKNTDGKILIMKS